MRKCNQDLGKKKKKERHKTAVPAAQEQNTIFPEESQKNLVKSVLFVITDVYV